MFTLIYKYRRLKLVRTLEQYDERPGLRPGVSYREEHTKFTMGRVDDWFNHRLFRLMMILSEILVDPGKVRILTMGPRNELELYMLVLNGFKWSLIDAVDLVASTNKITPADFSVSLPFNDNEFDVVFASHALSKSYDRETTCQEIKRVMRPGGLFAITDNHHTHSIETWDQDNALDVSGICTGFPDRWRTVVDLYADSDYEKVLYARTTTKDAFECIVRII